MEISAACKASTAKNYQDILGIHLLPVFGDMRALDITRNKPVTGALKVRQTKSKEKGLAQGLGYDMLYFVALKPV